MVLARRPNKSCSCVCKLMRHLADHPNACTFGTYQQLMAWHSIVPAIGLHGNLPFDSSTRSMRFGGLISSSLGWCSPGRA